MVVAIQNGMDAESGRGEHESQRDALATGVA